MLMAVESGPRGGRTDALPDAAMSAAAPLVKPLCSAYSDLLRRQGNTASPFVRWTQATGRSHAFAWLSGAVRQETLLFRGEPFTIRAGDSVFDALQKMRATVTLNPYEREMMLGYPYVIGRRDGEPIRGPVLLMPIRLEGQGGEIQVVAADEVVRFNSLPFRNEGDTEVRELAIRCVIDATPPFPFGAEGLALFADILVHALGI